MLSLAWSLVALIGSAFVAVVVICRKPMAEQIKAWRSSGEIDLEQLEGDMRNAVKDINFGGRS